MIWLNSMTKAIWEEKGFFGLHFHIIVHHWRNSGWNSISARTWRQELTQRPWTNGAYWIASNGLLILLMEPRTSSPELVPPLWAGLFLISHWLRCTNYRAYRWILRRHFIDWVSFSDDFCLWQVGIRISSILITRKTWLSLTYLPPQHLARL